jgi:hypothetical protein
MTPGDFDADADLLLQHHGFDDEMAPNVIRLARCVLGVGVQTVHARALPGDGALAIVHGQARIYVRSGLSPARQRWVIAHELGHWALGIDSSCQANEDKCDAFAAALLVPRRAFKCALTRVGLHCSTLARELAVTESCVALRLGEVTGCPVALLTPQRVRVRGDEFAWPSEIRNSRIPNTRKITLRDDRRRVAFMAPDVSDLADCL